MSLRPPSLSLSAALAVAGLLLSATFAGAQPDAFSNLGLPESYLPNVSMGVHSSFSPAYEFTVDTGGWLDSIRTPILWTEGINTVTLTLFTNTNGHLGTPLESISVSDLPNFWPLEVKPLTPFVSVQKPELVAGASYFLQASATGTATFSWCYNSKGDIGTLYIPSQGGGEPYINYEATRAAFSVSLSAVPEPSTYAVLCGTAALGLVVWRRAKR